MTKPRAKAKPKAKPKPRTPKRNRMRKEARDLLAHRSDLNPVDILIDFPWATKLSYPQVMYVYAYDGNNEVACKKIGVPASTGERWQKEAKIKHALAERLRFGVAPELVAGRDERMAYWTQTMRDQNTPIAAKLKASEYLGKAEGDFIERRILEGNQDNPVQIVIKTGVPDADPEGIDEFDDLGKENGATEVIEEEY